jgi:hypothetical protein
MAGMSSLRSNQASKASIIAGASLESKTYRNGFDISVPFYNQLTAKINQQILNW